MDVSNAVWRKSSRSGGQNGGQCVEVAELPEVMAVRDSKDPQGGHLQVGAANWAAFLQELKAGRLG